MFNWKESVENEWDNQALKWDKRSVNMWEHGSRKGIIPFFQQHLNTNKKVIDIGCGSGYSTYMLHEVGYNVEAIDISKEMIALAKIRLHNKNISLHHCDMNDIPKKDETYDGALAINVLEWTKNPYKSLMELKRVLKKDARLCVAILGPTAGPRAHGYRRVYGEDVILNGMMPWEFIQLAEENGFTLMDHYGVYKKEVKDGNVDTLPLKLKQSLSFFWVFMLKKR